jgi:hypothetical protein
VSRQGRRVLAYSVLSRTNFLGASERTSVCLVAGRDVRSLLLDEPHVGAEHSRDAAHSIAALP